MDTWSTHPALADDDDPHTPVIPLTSPHEAMNLNERVSNFLQTRPLIVTTSAVDAISRPSSALSGTSSFTDGSVTDLGANNSSKWQFAGAKVRDGPQCLLCWAPSSYQIPVTSHLEDRHNQAIHWLQSTRSVVQNVKSNDPSNSITLCPLHAEQYANGLWRFIPSKENIGAMIQSDRDDQLACNLTSQNSQPVSPRILPNLSDEFEVLLVTRDENILRCATQSVSTPEDLSYRIFHIPSLNPYLAFVSGLEINPQGHEYIDEHTVGIERILTFARDSFNQRFSSNVLN